MSRYDPRDAAGIWSIFDHLTEETLPAAEVGLSCFAAGALSELLNDLNDQQDWRREAALWPRAVR